MLNIRVMTETDIPLGMRLKQQNGWNQLEADWQRLLALEPGGCFVAEREGAGIGTAGTCVFGEIAWIAMVLVDADHRQHGIGTALMEHVLGYLENRGVVRIRVDATPLGRPIYERLGFTAEYELARYEGTLPHASVPAEVAPVPHESLGDLTALDRAVTATDRAKLIERLYGERPDMMVQVRREEKLAGFVTARPGARAWQLGPCLADASAGPALLASLQSRLGGQPVFIDVPLANNPARALVERLGLKEQRRLLRMGRGPRVEEIVDKLWASSGPEKG